MDPETLWHSESGWARLTRALLTPASIAWREGMALRRAMYERGWLASHAPAIPALSVGNLSVGGTGKTPVAAYIARELRLRGAHPALLIRGYGGDEPMVHALSNFDVPVVINEDRVSAARESIALGCDVAVLDDAFQHRRVQRIVDIVLIAAEQFDGSFRTLPGGPYREGTSALERADLILITRKADSRDRALRVKGMLQRVTNRPLGIVALPLGTLRDAVRTMRAQDGGPLPDEQPIQWLRDRDVLAIAGVGNPAAFGDQLSAMGARVTLIPFKDHHPFSRDDALDLARRAEGKDFVVCTLKDAVKLGPLWPRAAPTLWYVSQRIDL
jgi:tetraacyldisaccharide 4'-kinase